MHRAATPFGLVLLLSAACGGGYGSAVVDGTIGPYELPVDGTVFAIHDDETFLTFGEVAERQERKPAWVRVHLFEARFDPTRDLRFLEPAQRLETTTAISQGAYVRIAFRDATALEPGTRFEGELGPFGTNDVHVMWRFPQGEVELEDDYPPYYYPLGFDDAWAVTIDEAELSDDGHISGTLEASYMLAESDPEGTHAGTIRIEFDAPFVDERLAECNEASQWGAGDGSLPDGYACGVLRP